MNGGQVEDFELDGVDFHGFWLDRGEFDVKRGVLANGEFA